MRIVAWNCAAGLHFTRKYKPLLALRPDIAVISECADPLILKTKCSRLSEFSVAPIWIGGDPDAHRGLGVFFFNGAFGQRHHHFNPDLQWLLPIEVTSPRRFNLLAVLTGTAGLRKAERGPLLDALDFYHRFLTDEYAVIAGDFSNNAGWHIGRACNHRNAVEVLKRNGMVSAYHAATGENQGEETAKTYYRWRREEEGHHIDHVFLPRAWSERGFDLKVGSFRNWVRKSPTRKSRSDHAPLILDIANA